ncbi:hypothetical protein PGT21_026507 [Puccinia graminis f. sp. tritici]|uniref:Uncharacterized protein n=1 Tax=Puccinia graminis f. sp. tritici TaxID=56615 RepID=A0A5B0N7F9_PUCGR|nr:hypothetical protein PGT21_026507 [Puccinia graminis f. sp. tritici]
MVTKRYQKKKRTEEGRGGEVCRRDCDTGRTRKGGEGERGREKPKRTNNQKKEKATRKEEGFFVVVIFEEEQGVGITRGGKQRRGTKKEFNKNWTIYIIGF